MNQNASKLVSHINDWIKKYEIANSIKDIIQTIETVYMKKRITLTSASGSSGSVLRPKQIKKCITKWSRIMFILGFFKMQLKLILTYDNTS